MGRIISPNPGPRECCREFTCEDLPSTLHASGHHPCVGDFSLVISLLGGGYYGFVENLDGPCGDVYQLSLGVSCIISGGKPRMTIGGDLTCAFKRVVYFNDPDVELSFPINISEDIPQFGVVEYVEHCEEFTECATSGTVHIEITE